MSKITLSPRLTALLYLLGGATLATIVIALGGMTMEGRGSGKAIFVVGISGIAAGVGLTQLLWPPRPAGEGDGRSGWARAPFLQKSLWVVGGLAGVVAVAVLQVVMSGKY